MRNNRPIIIWLLTGFFLVYLMVVIGGITRLTGSGLSMADWKPISGALPPMNEQEWTEKFDLYKATPEFKIMNNDFTLDDFKSIFWWEYIHRALGRIIGLVFFIPFMVFWLRKKFDKPLLRKMILLFMLGGFQGLLGWFMVASGLVDNPHVSHYRLAAHLSTALLVMMYILWVIWDLRSPRQSSGSNTGLRKYGLILFAMLAIQTVYGAFVAGLKAGYGYHTLKLAVSLPHQFGSVLDHPQTVVFFHRYFAVVVLLFTLFIWFKARSLQVTRKNLRAATFVLLAILVQFSLGVITILNSVPLDLGVLHQAGAVMALSASLYLIHES